MARKGLHPVSPAFEAEALASLDSLYRTARRLTREPADAEDLVQETFLKAFRAADRFEPGTNLRAWLFTILHNTARNRVRDRENLRFERTRLFGRVRHIFVELGRKFHALDLLEDPRDIFYLEVEEILGVDVGEPPRLPFLGQVATCERGALRAVVPAPEGGDQNRPIERRPALDAELGSHGFNLPAVVPEPRAGAREPSRGRRCRSRRPRRW